jgi:2-polyprenyl-6-methoxyphenol hydroxylase-like FAD-dependent oxidoreductase
VVGADGRGSVVRRCAGITIQGQDASVCIAGLLLEGVGGCDQRDSVVGHDLGLCLLLHQGGGRARAYQVVPLEHRARYVGDGACGVSSPTPASPGRRSPRPWSVRARLAPAAYSPAQILGLTKRTATVLC